MHSVALLENVALVEDGVWLCRGGVGVGVYVFLKAACMRACVCFSAPCMLNAANFWIGVCVRLKWLHLHVVMHGPRCAASCVGTCMHGVHIQCTSCARGCLHAWHGNFKTSAPTAPRETSPVSSSKGPLLGL